MRNSHTLVTNHKVSLQVMNCINYFDLDYSIKHERSMGRSKKTLTLKLTSEFMASLGHKLCDETPVSIISVIGCNTSIYSGLAVIPKNGLTLHLEEKMRTLEKFHLFKIEIVESIARIENIMSIRSKDAPESKRHDNHINSCINSEEIPCYFMTSLETGYTKINQPTMGPDQFCNMPKTVIIV